MYYMQSKTKSMKILIFCFLSLFMYCAIAGALATSHRPVEKDSSAYELFNYYLFEEGKLSDQYLPDKEGIEAGPLIMHSAFRSEVEFDTNIYLTNNDEKFDVITLLSPSIGLELPIGDHKFSADYEVGFYLFGEYTGENYVDQRVRGLATLNFTDFTVTVEDVYRNFSHRAGSEDTNRVKHQDNNARVGIAAEFDQLKFDVGYSFGIDDFLSDEIIFTTPAGLVMTYEDKDRMNHTFDGRIAYRFLPKTSLIIDQYFGIINYDSPDCSNSYFIESMIGLQGELKDNLKIDLSGGFRYQDYEPADITVNKDFISGVARGGILYFITDKDLFNVNVERSIYESIYNDMNYYIVNLIGLHYSHAFNEKLSLSLFGKYQYTTYPEEATQGDETATRYDHLFGGGCVLRYDVKKWLSFDMRYEYKQRESRFSVFDYVDNVFTIRGTIGF